MTHTIVEAGKQLSELEKCLLNNYQRGMPVCPEPYAEIARELNVQGMHTTEDEVIACLCGLQKKGMISRIGAVFTPQKVGASTLAAMSVPQARMIEVAELVSSYSQVNHNYEREHQFNLWFVVTASTIKQVHDVLDDIEHKTGIAVLDLPMEADYHIDLGFPLWC